MPMSRALLSASLTGLTALAAACGHDAPPPAPGPDTPPGQLAPDALAELAASGARAKAIFVGQIVAIDERLSEPDADGRQIPFQFVTWKVERALRGVDAGRTWTGRFAGGTFPDGRHLSVSEVPELAMGQRALLLADDGDAGACALIGCRDGLLALDGAAALSADGLDQALAALDGGAAAKAVRARSADPRAPFAFTLALSGGPIAAPPVAARAEARAAEPDADPAEVEALIANGRNPVLR